MYHLNTGDAASPDRSIRCGREQMNLLLRGSVLTRVLLDEIGRTKVLDSVANRMNADAAKPALHLR